MQPFDQDNQQNYQQDNQQNYQQQQYGQTNDSGNYNNMNPNQSGNYNNMDPNQSGNNMDPNQAQGQIQQFVQNASPDEVQQVFQKHFEQLPPDQRSQLAQQMPAEYGVNPNDPNSMAQGMARLSQERPDMLQGILSHPILIAGATGLALIVARHMMENRGGR